jgi:beta-galactosidase
MRTFIPLTIVGLALALPLGAAQVGDELLQNGSFQAVDRSGVRPAGWDCSSDVRLGQEGDNRWLILESDTPTKSVSANQTVPMQPDWWQIRVSCKIRYTDVEQGTESWHDTRIAMNFANAAGQMVGEWPNVLHWTGTSNGWVEASRDYLVPRGATELRMSCSLFSTTGKAEYDDVSVKAIKTWPKPEDARLPKGVEARWDLASAYREETPTSGRVCINGLWRFHPAKLTDSAPPASGTGWGYFKVPASWPGPGGTCRMGPIGPDIWEAEALNLSDADAAWYEREITIPPEWAGRQIALDVDNVQTSATVLVDGKRVGELAWPGGQVDLTASVTPGKTHLLAVHVRTITGTMEQIQVMEPNLIERARTRVRMRGLCGDCFLVSSPKGPRITDVFVEPSVRNKQLGLSLEVADLAPETAYRIAARAVLRGGGAQAFGPIPLRTEDLEEGRFNATFPWADPKLWDLDQPNLYDLQVDLLGPDGTLLDRTTPVRFGFREFWIDGRQLVLNGRPFHIRALDFSNHTHDFGLASYDAVRETFRRARAIGFNYVIHSNYDYNTQSVCYLDDTLRAGDDAGFPMSFSIRHISSIYRDFGDPARRAEWEHIVRYLLRRVRNHPSVLMYAMDHNFLGYSGDQNPSRLDGIYAPSPDNDPGLAERREAAAMAEGIVHSIDPTRLAYHHESGNMGQFITLNCYLNWCPLQEKIEWPAHWARVGVKPIFFVELGLPHQASFGGHRTGPFIWRNDVSSAPLHVEYAAIYKGDAAYHLTPLDLSNYDTIERVYDRHRPFHISEVLGNLWSNAADNDFEDIKALFTDQVWPTWRTWGVPAVLPWDQADLFRVRERPAQDRRNVPTDWAHLQRPGLAPDYLTWNDDWLTTPEFGSLEMSALGRTFARVNRETLAYIAGPKARFTANDHNYRPGETIEKQAVVINDLLSPAEARWRWSAAMGDRVLAEKRGTVTVGAGALAYVPISFKLPADAADGAGAIELSVEIAGQPQGALRDRFAFDVLSPAPKVATTAKVAAYDPKGLTIPILQRAGIEFQVLTSLQTVPACDVLIIGREALGVREPAIDLRGHLSRGGRVLMLEQTQDVLEKRLGFRWASPCARRVFIRQPAHPVCRGLTDELLRDWRGSGTLVDPYPKTVGFERNYPTTEWCGFENTRVWKWGNYGSVASVLIEKPQRGDFAPILDCEFDLNYTPLLEYREGPGSIVFCQLDLSNRDGDDPAADRILANLLSYIQQPLPTPGRCYYVGGPEGAQTLRALAVRFEQVGAAPSLSPGDLLIVGEGATQALGPAAKDIAAAVERGANVFSLALTSEAANPWLPFSLTTESRSVLSTVVDETTDPIVRGLGNSELHWRGKINLPAITSECTFRSPDGVIGYVTRGKGKYVFCQVLPGMFDYKDREHLRISWQDLRRGRPR